MFCINISWFVCTFVAVTIATDSTGENYISESATAAPVGKLQPSTGVAAGAQTSSTAPADSGPSPYAATQPHSDHSSRQSPATAAPTVAAQTVPQTDDDRISLLRSLPPQEKGWRLIDAAKERNLGELEALLAAGANVGFREVSWNTTALHWAAAGADVEAARRLLAAGAEVDARDTAEWTPLHWAAGRGHVAVVRLLLAAGANPSARAYTGWTPLHLAAVNDRAEAAAVLVEAGSDRAARDNEGLTPLDIAREYSKQRAVQLLEGYSSLTATTLPE